MSSRQFSCLHSHPNDWFGTWQRIAKDKMGNSIIKLWLPYDMSDKANLHTSKKWNNAAECFTCFSRATIRPSAFSSFSKSSSRSMSDIGPFCKQTIQLDFCAMQVSSCFKNIWTLSTAQIKPLEWKNKWISSYTSLLKSVYTNVIITVLWTKQEVHGLIEISTLKNRHPSAFFTPTYMAKKISRSSRQNYNVLTLDLLKSHL